MNFDEQLRRALDTLSDRVRDEVARQLGVVQDELAAAAGAEREAAASQAALEARTRAEQEADARVTLIVAEAEGAAREAALQDGREQGLREGLEQGRREGHDEGRQRGVQEGREQGFEQGKEQGFEQGREQGFEQGRQQGFDQGRQRGFEEGRQEGFEAGRQQGLDEGRQQRGEERHANLRAGELAAGERLVDGMRAIDRARSLSEILDTLTSCAGREVHRIGVLLVQGGRVRGWRFLGFGDGFDDPTRIDMAADQAGIIAEAIRTRAPASGDGGSGVMPSFVELPAGREMLAVPVAMSGEVVAVLYADQGSEQEAEPSTVNWPAILEALTRHAARSLEAITAVRAAQILSERPQAPVAATAAEDTHHSAAMSGEAAGEHDAARRYARLLVSEIKLYHEAAVIAGRRERDLATRLGGEIARARVLYEQRVPAHVRRHGDHFHAELVRTLANGDSALLGQPI